MGRRAAPGADPGRRLGRLTAAPQFSPSGVSGTLHPSLEDDDVTLIIGEAGVTLSTPGGLVTVRYDACAAMTTRPDGARCLTGLDGFQVTVEPTLFGDVTAERIAVLDKAVPAAALVPFRPARHRRSLSRANGRPPPRGPRRTGPSRPRAGGRPGGCRATSSS